MNTNYSEYYRGTTMVNTYGSAAGEKQVVKYEFIELFKRGKRK
jgi:hypothetical protein